MKERESPRDKKAARSGAQGETCSSTSHRRNENLPPPCFKRRGHQRQYPCLATEPEAITTKGRRIQ